MGEAENEIAYLFRRGRGLSSRLISWYCNGYGGFSHVDLRLRNGDLVGARDDKTYGFNGEILKPGIRHRPWNYEKVAAVSLATKPCSLTEYNDWEAFALKHIGDQYDPAAIFSFITGIPLTSGDGFWICSQFGVDSAQEIHCLPSNLCVPDRQITPNSLRLMLNVSGFTIIDKPPQYSGLLI